MKMNIAIVAGGDSGEYDISIRSGRKVAESFDLEKYTPYLIQVKGAHWFFEDGDVKYPMDKNDFTLNQNGVKVKFACVFCAIHGTPGENGKLPAYFEMLNIPFTSSDSLVSAVTFNKKICNRVVSTLDVTLADSLHFYKGEEVCSAQVLDRLELPLFVKPNAGGSSVGMTKVSKAAELDGAVARAFAEDDEILIEEFIPGRELTCGLLEVKGEMIVFPLCEIVSKREFFDFEAKYDPSLAEEIIPAQIPADLAGEIREESLFLYKKLNCKGVVRFDYIFSQEKEKLYFLEVNTVPGLTAESIVPKMAREMGVSLQQLFSMMVEDALWRCK